MPHHIRPELYDDIARQLEQRDEPFNLQWMQDKNVTLEELHALCGQLALIIRGFSALQAQEQITFITRGVLTPRPIDKPAEMISGARHPDGASANTPNEDQSNATDGN